MRAAKISFVAGAMLASFAWSFTYAATATPATTAPATKSAPTAQAAPQPRTPECEKVGGETSKLIDANATAPNVAKARAVFQVGIMECMEGDDAAANGHYQEAKNLLGVTATTN